jgi:hypothetical protein
MFGQQPLTKQERAYSNIHTWGGCATSVTAFNRCYCIGRGGRLLVLEPLRVVLELLMPHPDLRLDHPLLLLHRITQLALQKQKRKQTALTKEFYTMVVTHNLLDALLLLGLDAAVLHGIIEHLAVWTP